MCAGTLNDSGALFGEFCFPESGSCVWLLGMSTICKEGDKYPVLANSDAGSEHLEIYCDQQLDDGLYRYVFANFDAVDDLVKKGTRIGFAIPLQVDQFKVVRFLLNGATPAITSMREIAEKKVNPQKIKPKKNGTSDQYL
jgi:uncharacterized protein YqjF (DUF2071 family)